MATNSVIAFKTKASKKNRHWYQFLQEINLSLSVTARHMNMKQVCLFLWFRIWNKVFVLCFCGVCYSPVVGGLCNSWCGGNHWHYHMLVLVIRLHVVYQIELQFFNTLKLIVGKLFVGLCICTLTSLVWQ